MKWLAAKALALLSVCCVHVCASKAYLQYGGTPLSGSLPNVTLTVYGSARVYCLQATGPVPTSIEWYNPQGQLVSRNGGVAVNQAAAGGGGRVATLTFQSYRQSQGGKYECIVTVPGKTLEKLPVLIEPMAILAGSSSAIPSCSITSSVGVSISSTLSSSIPVAPNLAGPSSSFVYHAASPPPAVPTPNPSGPQVNIDPSGELTVEEGENVTVTCTSNVAGALLQLLVLRDRFTSSHSVVASAEGTVLSHTFYFIRGSADGRYWCTLPDVRSENLEISVAAIAPTFKLENVSVYWVRDAKVNVSWSLPDLPPWMNVLGYKLNWDKVPPIPIGLMSVGAEMSSVEVDVNFKGVVFISVWAFSRGGEGPPVLLNVTIPMTTPTPSTSTTSPTPKPLLDSPPPAFPTPTPSAPQILPPDEVSSYPLPQPGTVRVTWTQAPNSTHGLTLMGYSVLYREEGGDMYQAQQVTDILSPGELETFQLEGLELGTTYELRVAVVTLSGVGKYSDVINVTTYADCCSECSSIQSTVFVSFEVDMMKVDESDTLVHIDVFRYGPMSAPITLRVTDIPLTAKRVKDYSLQSSSLVFLNTERMVERSTVVVRIREDSTPEQDPLTESFRLVLSSSAAGGGMQPAVVFSVPEMEVHIRDNDY